MNTENSKPPYVGPRTFEAEERDRFFGREREARDLFARVVSERLVLFYAQSGAGKSSLVNTCLIPDLKARDFVVFPTGRVGGEALPGNEVKNIFVSNLINSLTKSELEQDGLSKLSITQIISRLKNSVAPAPQGDDDDQLTPPHVLIIDQFEELFSTHHEAWTKREDFFQQLAEAMEDHPYLRAVLVMREDYIAQLDPYAHLLPGRLGRRYYMQRLEREAAIKAVKGPVEKMRPFASGVAEKLVDDLSIIKVQKPGGTLGSEAGQFVEPVQLQVVCFSLWERLLETSPEGNSITEKDLLEVGDVDEALAKYYAGRVAGVAHAKNVNERNIREWFGKKLITADGIRNMVAQERDGESGGLDDEIIQEFVKRGDLVRAEHRGGATFYELTHDRLVEPILENNKEWVRNNPSLLQQQTALWLQQGRSNALLLRGKPLRKAGKEAETLELTRDEKAFLTASRISERTQKITWISTGFALVIMIVLSIIAVQQSVRATRNAALAEQRAQEAEAAQQEEARQRQISEAAQQEEARQRQLALQKEIELEAQRSAARAQIYLNRPGELYTSTLLAIDSLRRSPSAEAEEILRRNLTLLPIPVAQFTQGGKINAIELSPEGDTFATTSADGTACAWRIEEDKVSHLFCTPSGGAALNALAFNRDGSFLVTGDQAGLIQVLDPESGNVLHAFQRIDSQFSQGLLAEVKNENLEDGAIPLHVPIRGIGIRPTQKQSIVVAYDDGYIPVFDPITGNISSRLSTISRPNVSGLSPNGAWQVTGSEAGQVIVWNLSLGTGDPFSPSTHRGGVLAMAFAPTDNKVATAGVDSVAITNLSIEKELFRIPIQRPIRDMAFSPDGSWFVAGSDDHRIRVWDTFIGNELLSMSQDGSVTEVVVSSNGQWIATTGEDRTARVWDAETGTEMFQIPLKARGSRLAFINDDKWLVTTDETGAIAIWDISVMTLPELSIPFEGIVANVQYSPSGEWLAVSSEDKVWLLSPNQQTILMRPDLGTPAQDFDSNIVELVFSPNSKVLGILTENETAIYDLTTGTPQLVPVTERIESIAFTPDSQQLIASDLNGNLQAWNVLNAELLPDANEFPQGSTLTSSAKVLAVGSQDKITLLREDSNSAFRTIEFSGDNILMIFNKDGSLLASSSSSGEITIFQYQGGKFTKLTSFLQVQASSLAFHPSQTLLAIGTAKDVFFVDIASGKEVARIPHPDNVNDLAFSDDGNILVTASSEILQFWEMNKIRPIESDDLIATACSYLYEDFSPAQWEVFFPGEAHKPLCEDLP
jgi:WD40 repeat protein